MNVAGAFLTAVVTVSIVHSVRAQDMAVDALWDRQRLLDGDWRQELADSGISFDASLIQAYQGSSSGNGNDDWHSGGKGDFFITLDGGKLGLWQGLYITAHAEFLDGEDANALGNRVLLPNRNQDRWGVGYFRYALSSDLVDGLASVGVGLRDEQGIEAFYNMAVTPWISVTADLQVVMPATSSASTATTMSVRTKIRF